MKNIWKVIAIIFICLFTIETAFVCVVVKYGMKSINNEIKCSNEVCFNEDYTSFLFDDTTNTCACYNDGVIKHQEVLS